MKKILTTATVVLLLAWAAPAVQARDCAELYVKLTCHTCHGPEGRGMIRTETKEKYYLRHKEMYREMLDKGMPLAQVEKLQPLYRQQFDNKDDFVKAIEELLGAEDTQRYKEIVIAVGGRIYYRKGDIIPGFETYPRHAGNKKLYLYRQMKDILEGRRTNGSSEAMRGIQPFLESNKITDDDLMCIAEYLSNVRD